MSFIENCMILCWTTHMLNNVSHGCFYYVHNLKGWEEIWGTNWRTYRDVVKYNFVDIYFWARYRRFRVKSASICIQVRWCVRLGGQGRHRWILSSATSGSQRWELVGKCREMDIWSNVSVLVLACRLFLQREHEYEIIYYWFGGSLFFWSAVFLYTYRLISTDVMVSILSAPMLTGLLILILSPPERINKWPREGLLNSNGLDEVDRQ